MDMSGQFAKGSAAAARRPRVPAPEVIAPPAPRTGPAAWRDGVPIAFDLAQVPPPEPRRILAEHVAIVALFVATWAMAINQLRL